MLNKELEGVKNMCEAMDKAEARGVAKGEIRGKVLAYADVGLTVDEIISKTGLPKE